MRLVQKKVDQLVDSTAGVLVDLTADQLGLPRVVKMAGQLVDRSVVSTAAWKAETRVHQLVETWAVPLDLKAAAQTVEEKAVMSAASSVVR